MEAPGQLPSLPSPKSGADPECRDEEVSIGSESKIRQNHLVESGLVCCQHHECICPRTGCEEYEPSRRSTSVRKWIKS